MGAPSFLMAIALISSGTMASIAATSITLTASSHNSDSTKAPDIFQPLARDYKLHTTTMSVDVVISKEETLALARPQILTPIQKELIDWTTACITCLFPKTFWLAKLGHLPKRLLEYNKNAPLCVACQFGTTHCHPWRTKSKASGSIHTEVYVEPKYGVSMDQILSAHPGLIPHMSGFLTSRRIWGCTTF